MTYLSDDIIFDIRGEEDFQETTLRIFEYQFDNNKIYRDFVTCLGLTRESVKSVPDIPFLPVEFFRDHRVISGEDKCDILFRSSGTTGTVPGRHYVKDIALYEKSFLKTFRLFYGDPCAYVIIALLPSYTEREGSSLVFMTDRLIRESGNEGSGFCKGDPYDLNSRLQAARRNRKRVLLLGVSFALLDLAEKYSPDLTDAIVMETGGMKGRRRELTRMELHDVLKDAFRVESIHSEYGMTELLSQAYSKGEGIFFTPPWMKVLIRDPRDPLSLYRDNGKTGGINIIDLANINSCSFISSGDLGRLRDDGGFEVLGWFDSRDIRGCNLMAE